ncbi:hydantoinase B/oxoprolinase family protein [Euryhalocaulis caribicus]|uniref:hydantoinase B/oxoprolinase family protein n=1 Tax=Euryhalocaulis caribicus TaxID=1161401 RepID=UPI00039CD3B6|nr:hydantoinase B/oxoprolinase family protein [Euryhalocaulis caribicus]
MTNGRWEIWIDRGGTFTDFVARAPDGEMKTQKLLSQSDRYTDSASEGVRRLLGLRDGEAIPADRIAAVKMGTTVATNALLERKGRPTCFITNEGFGDALKIGDQTRPDIFALRIDKPAPLHSSVAELDTRRLSDGAVLRPLDLEAAKSALQAAKDEGARSAAICLMHAYDWAAEEEEKLAALAAELGFEHVSRSSDVDPLVKFVPRASTTVTDAYLSPVLAERVDAVAHSLQGAPLYFLTSSGGLAAAETFRGRDALLSGPAGGVVGMAMTAKRAGYPKVIGFDMGGTSSDVSRFDGETFDRRFQTDIEGYAIRAPMMAVHTVAAGGGSILTYDKGRALAGPESAGADPGPAAYGRGGPATVTDANAALGRIEPRFFPNVFGPNEDQPFDADASRKALADLAAKMEADGPEAAAEGFLAVAVENMAQAIKHVSLAQGVKPSDYALAGFGGAAGQVVCRVAEALAMETVLIHPFGSVLSAYGIGLAQIEAAREAALEIALDDDGLKTAVGRARDLAEAARTSVIDQRADADSVGTRFELRLRMEGSDTALPVSFTEGEGVAPIRERFEADHQRLFGFSEHGRTVEIESVAAYAVGDPPGAGAANPPAPPEGEPEQADTSCAWLDGEWTDIPVYRLEKFGTGGPAAGPALIVSDQTQVFLNAGWRAKRLPDGMLALEHVEAMAAGESDPTIANPVDLELFNRRFMSVAEEMGVVLERTASSVNIKERLDFSCAVFDADGSLVANAPHMPVHLGSMSASVQSALEANPDIGPGDAVAVNAPYQGGTHLPDVTLVSPVHDPDTGERLFFVASRGHHADIGGITPGSMPAFSKTIDEEGVSFDNVLIRRGGELLEDRIREILGGGPHPARNPDRNMADIRAQLAACARGEQALNRLIADRGKDVVKAYMRHVRDNAEEAVRQTLGALENGEFEIRLDDGDMIRVAITVDQDSRSAVIDFTGTSPQRGDNFNAPASVARAAVLYVFRCLAGGGIPLNEGCLVPLDIRIPDGSMINPNPPAAVVAGNVETSQMIVDALFGATRALAGSQGTMNNLTFGDGRMQYYETICGGAGAGADFDGASAVHTHMTNSRLTDPEVIERRFPVRLVRHAVRGGSGGQGRQSGGDGSVREIEFGADMTVSLISSHRAVPPRGLDGGKDAALGKQRVIRAGGETEELEGRFRIEVSQGDRLVIETPGGGGYGSA